MSDPTPPHSDPPADPLTGDTPVTWGRGQRLRSILTAVRRAGLLGGQRAWQIGRAFPLATALGMVAPPLDLRILSRTLIHTALVGLGAGLVGAGFFAALEHTQRFILEGLAGYAPLRAHGELPV